MQTTAGEPSPCPECKARRQVTVDGDVVHARAGTAACPPVPFDEGPVHALTAVLAELTIPNRPFCRPGWLRWHNSWDWPY